MKIHKSGSD
jgi:hypothetical protein